MDKIKRFIAEMKKQGISLAVFFNVGIVPLDRNIVYFAGYEGSGALVIPQKKKPYLLVPRMELSRAKKSRIKIVCLKKKSRLFEQIGIRKTQKICIDFSVCNVHQLKSLRKYTKKIVDSSLICSNLRKIKDPEEISKIKQACKITDNLFDSLIKNFKGFSTESDIAAFIEYQTRKNGCDLSFPPIVASGKNASSAHHTPQAKPLQKGFCILDFGVSYKGYCSDITRTVYLGKPTRKEIAAYNNLLEVQKSAIKNIPKKTCAELYEEVKSKLKDNFTHNLGHGIGVYIHESPNIGEKSKDKFEEGTVFTIEPGIYFKNYGIRIEDDILFQKGKPIILTKSPKNLIMIKRNL